MTANRIDDKIRQLKTQVASLEQLLQTEKKASLKQPDKLKQALSNLRQSCESLELDLPSGEPSTLHISGQDRTEKLLAKRAAELERQAERERVGITEVPIRHLQASLQEHTDAWFDDLERAGRAPEYRRKLKARIDRLSSELHWATLTRVW